MSLQRIRKYDTIPDKMLTEKLLHRANTVYHGINKSKENKIVTLKTCVDYSTMSNLPIYMSLWSM